MMRTPRYRSAIGLLCLIGLARLTEGIPTARADAFCDQIRRLDGLAVWGFAGIRGPVVSEEGQTIHYEALEVLPNATSCTLSGLNIETRHDFACHWNGTEDDAVGLIGRIADCLNRSIFDPGSLDGNTQLFVEGDNAEFVVTFSYTGNLYSLSISKRTPPN